MIYMSPQTLQANSKIVPTLYFGFRVWMVLSVFVHLFGTYSLFTMLSRHYIYLPVIQESDPLSPASFPLRQPIF